MPYLVPFSKPAAPLHAPRITKELAMPVAGPGARFRELARAERRLRERAITRTTWYGRSTSCTLAATLHSHVSIATVD